MGDHGSSAFSQVFHGHFEVSPPFQRNPDILLVGQNIHPVDLWIQIPQFPIPPNQKIRPLKKVQKGRPEVASMGIFHHCFFCPAWKLGYGAPISIYGAPLVRLDRHDIPHAGRVSSTDPVLPYCWQPGGVRTCFSRGRPCWKGLLEERHPAQPSWEPPNLNRFGGCWEKVIGFHRGSCSTMFDYQVKVTEDMGIIIIISLLSKPSPTAMFQTTSFRNKPSSTLKNSSAHDHPISSRQPQNLLQGATAGRARGSKGRLQVQAAQATVGMARRRAEVGLGTLDRLPAHLGVLGAPLGSFERK